MSEHDEARWPIRCACGEQYTEERWKSLRLIGSQNNGDERELELRVCVCGSTISVKVGESSPP